MGNRFLMALYRLKRLNLALQQVKWKAGVNGIYMIFQNNFNQKTLSSSKELKGENIISETK